MNYKKAYYVVLTILVINLIITVSFVITMDRLIDGMLNDRTTIEESYERQLTQLRKVK